MIDTLTSLMSGSVFPVALVTLALVALLWKQTHVLQALAGTSTRARDRERHDYHRIIQQLLEKHDARDRAEMARGHQMERMRQSETDADLEKAISQPPKKSKSEDEDDEFVPPEHYEN